MCCMWMLSTYSVFINYPVALSLFFILQNLLDMMIAEEEGLKKRLLNSILSCRKELGSLCEELQLSPYEVVSAPNCVLCTSHSVLCV